MKIAITSNTSHKNLKINTRVLTNKLIYINKKVTNTKFSCLFNVLSRSTLKGENIPSYSQISLNS